MCTLKKQHQKKYQQSFFMGETDLSISDINPDRKLVVLSNSILAFYQESEFS